MHKTEFLDLLSDKGVLVSDGATGTNLQQSGLPPGVSAEKWLLENPEAILTLNCAFVDAGADILLTCTFGGTRLRLEASGLGDAFEALNRSGVEITQKAALGRDVLVAGSIGPTGHMLVPFGTLTAEEAQAEFRDQATVLCESGVDLIVIETQFDINEASAAVLGVRSISSTIPLVCSFSYDRGTRTMMGVRPADMSEAIDTLDVDVLGINCGRSLQQNLDALEQLRAVTDKPIWFKPNAGLPETDAQGQTFYPVTPEEVGALVPAWLEAGAQIVGGCCGTSVPHLQAIAAAVHA